MGHFLTWSRKGAMKVKSGNSGGATDGTPKKRGRKPIGVAYCQITITDEDREYARELGGGGPKAVSKGIRAALAACRRQPLLFS